MWTDNETELDYVNFGGVADTIAEIVRQAGGKPISIGVSGAWGIGKSSMIKLTRQALVGKAAAPQRRDFIFVEFNAWLYQGYDDARAALMDVIAATLDEEAQNRQKGIDKAKTFLARVNWLRVAKLAAGAGTMAFGLPPGGLVGEVWELARRTFAGEVGAQTLHDATSTAEKVTKEASALIGPATEKSPPKEIQALRRSFEEVLEELDVILVVLIDDLDRCLPPTTISTLEAVRLFLFLKNTAFVIAADDAMIKHAVRDHFKDLQDDTLVTNYFDKLIQVPIRVPALGTQEVRAYMMMLYVANSGLPDADIEMIRVGICSQLKQTWQNKRVDLAFIRSLKDNISAELVGKLETAERLAPLMATASGIAGNPRLIKRFLNALSIRMTISDAQGVGVDEAVLAKLLLFERLGSAKAYAELTAKVSTDAEGKPGFLAEWETDIGAGKEVNLPDPWNDNFIKEWLLLPPALADRDLRGALYVGREHAPLITPQDRLSSQAAELLTALLQYPGQAARLKEKLSKIPRAETTVMMDRLLDSARREQEWGTPAILDACIAMASADPPQGERLAAFLVERPPAQIRASIVPKIGDQAWAKKVFDAWESKAVSQPVKNAIKTRKK